jgi:hypothetical protein
MLTVRTSTSIHQADLCRPNKIRQASLIRAINSQLTTNTTKKTEEDVKLIKGEENQHEEYPASRRWFQTSLISVATVGHNGSLRVDINHGGNTRVTGSLHGSPP